MKKYLSLSVIIIFLISIILQGCSSLPNQPFVKKDFNENSSLKIARYETPNYRLYSSGAMAATMVISGVLFGGIGAGLGYAIHHATTYESANPEIPDFGKMVMDKFVERSTKEIPGWPKMNVQETVLKESLPVNKTGFVLEIEIGDIRIEKSSGLAVSAVIKMRDKDNNVVAEKGYAYDPGYFGRICTWETLKADDFKKLKEEFAFAADKTVDDFINHFKSSQQMTQK